jgi:hypothetical protein
MRKSRKKKAVETKGPSNERVERLKKLLEAVAGAIGVKIPASLSYDQSYHTVKDQGTEVKAVRSPHLLVGGIHVQWDSDEIKWVVYTVVCHPGVRYRRDGTGEPDDYEDNVIGAYYDNAGPNGGQHMIAERVGKALAEDAIANALENFSEHEMIEEEIKLNDLIEPRPWGKRKYIPPTKISSSKR